MNTVINELFAAEKIEAVGLLPFSACRVIHPELLLRKTDGWHPISAIVFLAPYYSGEHKGRNLSLYAVPRDYHLYFRELYQRLEAKLREIYPTFHFCGFADHSPIGEVGAAAKAGLGVIGDKGQLIHPKYGSYTFIGEILTDLPFAEYDLSEVGFCLHCGACTHACPAPNDCLSDRTQRKGDLSEETKALIKSTGIAWGCDLCRTCCPMNTNAAVTPISFFYEDLIACPSAEQVEAMSKEEFATRAFSWRGRQTILRNLNIWESREN